MPKTELDVESAAATNLHSFKSKRKIAAATILLVSLGFVVVMIGRRFNPPDFVDNSVCSKYVVIIDAGSSGSRVQVFTFNEKAINTNPFLAFGRSCKTRPGLSSFEENPSDAGESLKPCLAAAESLVPASFHSNTRIFLAATAGLRMTKLTNTKALDAIMSSARQTLRESSFEFEDNYARIMTGNEEGITAWIALNYLLGNLQKETETSGAVEIGGASQQIVYSLPRVEVQNTKDMRSYFYNRKQYDLYSHSYLCLGQDQAYKKYLASLITSGTTVENPCSYKGFKETFSFQDVYKPPCTPAPSSTPFQTNTDFVFVGTGNQEQCQNQLRKVFFSGECGYQNNECGIGGIYQPPMPPKKRFFGLSVYAYNANFLHLPSSEFVTLRDLKDAVTKSATQSWTEVVTANPKIPQEFLRLYSFSTQFTVQNLRALKFNDDDSFKFSNEIKETGLKWVLGFFVLQEGKCLADLSQPIE